MYTALTVPAPSPNVYSKPRAHSLGPNERKDLGLKVIRGASVTDLAKAHEVSRKFVYQQGEVAKEAVSIAFSAPAPVPDEKVLFTINVTKTTLRRMIMCLLLRCHSPYRGVMAFLEDVFDHRVSIGTINNIVQEAIGKAREINASIPLDRVKGGLHDEIYQNSRPVLVGVDAHSSFCYLLAQEDCCDGTTWGCHLLDLKEKQGFAPDYLVADQGMGLRAGFKEVYPDISCFADVFHMLKDFGDVLRYYENRLATATEELQKIETKMSVLKRKSEKQSKCSRALGITRAKQRCLTDLVSALSTLREWLRHDILAIAGPKHAVRVELINFVIEELRARETGSAKVVALRKKIENAKDEVVAFAGAVDAKLIAAAIKHDFTIAHLEQISLMLARSRIDARRYEIENKLRAELRGRFHQAVSIVIDILESTPRASSLVESVNSRLRSYFFLRRQVGHGFLELLQFYLNHRILVRSDRSHRTGQSPRKIMTGNEHEHWLDLLGFPKSKRAA